MLAPHGSKQPPTDKERASSARARSARSALPLQRSKRSFESCLVNAAVAARWSLPPGVAARAGHGSLQLIDVAHEVALAPVQRLLELFQLGPPALDPVLAQLHVRVELRLAQLQVALALPQLEDPRVDRLLGDRSWYSRQRHPAQERGKRVRLLRRDLYSEDE